MQIENKPHLRFKSWKHNDFRLERLEVGEKTEMERARQEEKQDDSVVWKQNEENISRK